MTKTQALYSFWSSFGLPAYDAYTVPQDATMPRITYEAVSDYLGGPAALSASLWYIGTEWNDIEATGALIGEEIGTGGKTVHYDGGILWIKRGSPFMQRMSDPDQNVRRILLNIEIEFI